MQPIGETPFLKILLPFVFGILVAYCGYENLYDPKIEGFVVVLTFILWLIYSIIEIYINTKVKYKKVFLFLLLIISGFTLTLYQIDLHKVDYVQRHFTSGDWLLIKINSEVKTKKWLSFDAKVLSMNRNGEMKDVFGSIKVVVEPKAEMHEIQYGDLLWIKGSLNEISKNKNPNTFNPQKYYGTKNQYHQIISNSESWEVAKKGDGFDIYKLAFIVKNKIVKHINEGIRTPNERALVSALVVGHRVGMEEEVKNAYSLTGATHVLAVSGSHLMVLIWITQALFKKWNNNSRYAKLLALIIQLLLVWCFVFITGIPSSILRAGVMVSLLLIGTFLRKESNALNTLLVSIFLILLMDTKYLFDIGFQLSVSAVAGMILFYNPIYRLLLMYFPCSKVVQKSIAISLSAQLITCPISMYYFHNLPIVFLVTGLIIVPISNIILCVGLLMVVIDPIWASLSNFLGNMLWVVAYFSNSFVTVLSKFSLSSIQGIIVSPMGLLWLFAIIYGLYLYLVEKEKRGIFITLSFLFLLAIQFQVEGYIKKNSKQFMIFFHKELQIMAVNAYGRNTLMLKDKDDLADNNILPSQLGIICSQSEIRIHEMKDSILLLENGKQEIKINNLEVADNRDKSNNNGPENSYWIVGRNTEEPYLYKSIKYPDLIICLANSKGKIRSKWAKYCFVNHIPYFDIEKQGAFILEL